MVENMESALILFVTGLDLITVCVLVWVEIEAGVGFE